MPDDKNLIRVKTFLKLVFTATEQQPHRESSQPREALSEKRDRPTVLAQPKGLQQRPDTVEQNSGGVLLKC